MNDCNVCVYADFDEQAEVWLVEKPCARRPHKCSECGQLIAAGQQYQKNRIFYDGAWEVWKTCAICAEIRAAFSCDGETLGGVFWEQFQECFDGLNESCFDKLQTVAAKKYLRVRWMRWKGLTR